MPTKPSSIIQNGNKSSRTLLNAFNTFASRGFTLLVSKDKTTRGFFGLDSSAFLDPLGETTGQLWK